MTEEINSDIKTKMLVGSVVVGAANWVVREVVLIRWAAWRSAVCGAQAEESLVA